MTDEKLEEEMRQLHKLLREYNANSGMAGFVCSVPVSLMPDEEQSRLIDGFGTPDNLRVLEMSRKQLLQARDLPLSDTESEKVESAIPVLQGLYDAFTSYARSAIDRDELRERVRELLRRPIPQDKDGLIDVLSHQVETVLFLAGQPVTGKDSWDRMVDCVQLYEALVRMSAVCERLEALLPQLQAVTRTRVIADSRIGEFESFFSGDRAGETVPELFSQIERDIQVLWTEE